MLYDARMAITREQLVCMLDGEIAAISDIGLREQVRAMLVEPAPMRCAWDYGVPGETYSCWKVAADISVGIVYCEDGFGPGSPWGLVWLSEGVPNMGQDSGWFATFCEAAGDLLDLTPASPDVD